MGNLQREASGRYTARICVEGVRMSRSTRTCNPQKAETYLQRMLAPYGRGEQRIPLADVWRRYERSPARRELSAATLHAKRVVWFHFARWVEDNRVEITHLRQLTAEVIADYLRQLRTGHCAGTYNNHVCVLREVYRVVAEPSEREDDPWRNVRLLADDSHARREFTRKELARIFTVVEEKGEPWHLLFCIGMYTGLRLGDCCTLEWQHVNLARGVIQVVPRKTRRHMHGVPVTIPIHPELATALQAQTTQDERYVLPQLAAWYLCEEHWRVGYGLEQIFRAAQIVTSVRLEGRTTATPDATFHSLRHTFVSFSANAGVPLTVVQSIVGHASSAMTRHYYHENEDVLRRAIEAIPGRDSLFRTQQPHHPPPRVSAAVRTLRERLAELETLRAENLISLDEYHATRTRMLNEF